MPEPAQTAPLRSDAASLQRRDTKLLRILAMSRYAVGVAVVGTFVVTTALADLLCFGVASALVIGSLAYAVSRVAPRQEPSALLSRSDHD